MADFKDYKIRQLTHTVELNGCYVGYIEQNIKTEKWQAKKDSFATDWSYSLPEEAAEILVERVFAEREKKANESFPMFTSECNNVEIKYLTHIVVDTNGFYIGYIEQDADTKRWRANMDSFTSDWNYFPHEAAWILVEHEKKAMGLRLDSAANKLILDVYVFATAIQKEKNKMYHTQKNKKIERVFVMRDIINEMRNKIDDELTNLIDSL